VAVTRPVRVYLTIDTECAEERGATAPPLGWDLRVWGRFANQRRALGIELIMDELERAGLRGTFFTEALGSAYFGEAGLAEVCAALVGRGHDVQLHTHPRQIRANWRTLGEAAAPDDVAAYDVATQAAMLRQGVAILERCGVPTGAVLAFRAGNFGASNATWQAMAEAGLVLSSNYNPCYFELNCKMRSPAASAGLFRAERGIWELPISTFRERGGGHRHLQITAVSLPEIEAFLDDAHRAGLGEVTIVTHSFELYHTDSPSRRRGRPNTVNLLRLRGLCRHLAAHPDRFEVDTCGALARRLRDGGQVIAAPIAVPRGRPALRVARFAAQAYKRLEARVGWSPPVV
jgi:hypothetical protein